MTHNPIFQWFWRTAFILVLVTLVAVLPMIHPVQALPGPQSDETIRFAVIGDYGSGNDNAAAVADLVKSWEPDLIITLGDNNYPSGEAESIDEHIGQFYHEYIYPYKGQYGPGADVNRFFPVLGNHDWRTEGAAPYIDYFELPGNERYYDFVWGPVHFFALDSDSDEPDGIEQDSIQAQWFQERITASDKPWKVVYFHHTPYSSGPHGEDKELQWPFAEWGATIVLAGHDHIYERIIRDGFTYIVNGVGGGNLYELQDAADGSLARFNATYGAMLVEAGPEQMTFQFYTIEQPDVPMDSFTIERGKETLVVPAEADARVNEEEPATNYGNGSSLRVDSEGGATLESYLRFTVSGVKGPVEKATLRVFASTDSAAGLSVYTSDGGWEEAGEAGLTWLTRPNTGSEPITTLDRVLASTWADFDVTSVVTGDGTYNFALRTDSTDGITFMSRENNFVPHLVITYASE